MPALILCHAPEDIALASTVGDYLGANLAYEICYEQGAVRDGFDLVDATERALSAEAALVMLSPHSVPRSWKRDRWEPVFFQKPAEFGILLGFVLLQDCKFPDLVRRHRFFDATGDLPAEIRRIRRWLLRPHQPSPHDRPFDAGSLELRAKVADRPAVACDVNHARAAAFAVACQPDFEAVHKIDCGGRSRAGILGDLGHALNLRLGGTVHENRAQVSEWCRNHRCLFVIENALTGDREFLSFGGMASVIFTIDSPARETAGIEQIASAYLATPRDENACAALTGDAVFRVTELLGSDFESGLRLGWAFISFLRTSSRFAEAVEALDLMENAARQRQDALALYRIAWEQSWLHETSPEGDAVCILPTAGEQVTQLSLF